MQMNDKNEILEKLKVENRELDCRLRFIKQNIANKQRTLKENYEKKANEKLLKLKNKIEQIEQDAEKLNSNIRQLESKKQDLEIELRNIDKNA